MKPFVLLQRSRFTITEVQAFSYNGPRITDDRLEPPFGLIVKVNATGPNGPVSGIGESRVSDKYRESSWTFLTETAQQLAGTQLQWRTKPMETLIQALDRFAPNNSERNGDDQAFKAIRRACENALMHATSDETPDYQTLQERRPDEDWPTVVIRPDEAHNVPAIDLMNLYPMISRFVTYPEVKGPYKEEPANYSKFLLPGAPVGVPASFQLEMTALAFGFPTHRTMTQNFVTVPPTGTSPFGFKTVNSTDISHAAFEAARDKAVTKRLLEMHQIPHPKGRAFQPHETGEAEKMAQNLGYPLVVKPADGNKGYGITTNIESPEELRAAFQRAIDAGFSSGNVIVEEQATGVDYRFLVTEEKVLSVIRRERAHVVGNGTHSVAELITWACAIRKRNPNLSRRRFQPDVIQEMLAEQGYSPKSVPDPGTVVHLARTENMSQGGNSVSVLPETHPTVAKAAVNAVRAMGLAYGGVDAFLEDHTRALDEQDFNIIEVNTGPGVSAHQHPMYGESVDPYYELVSLTARKSGASMTPPSDHNTVQITVEGELRPGSYQKWIKRAADELGLSGSIRLFPDSQQAEIVVWGRNLAVANLLRLAFVGSQRSLVSQTRAEPISMVPDAGFRILGEE